MAIVLLINGPNLNLLGEREPALYGDETLETIVVRLTAQAETGGYRLVHFQSNAEHELIDRIHRARNKVASIVINPGAYGHTSLALADALAAVAVPYYEVHISNVFARERARARLVLAPGASGFIAGFGTRGYDLALAAAIARLEADKDRIGRKVN